LVAFPTRGFGKGRSKREVGRVSLVEWGLQRIKKNRKAKKWGSAMLGGGEASANDIGPSAKGVLEPRGPKQPAETQILGV